MFIQNVSTVLSPLFHARLFRAECDIRENFDTNEYIHINFFDTNECLNKYSY